MSSPVCVDCVVECFSQSQRERRGVGGGGPVTHLELEGLGQAGVAASALLGWFTACDVSHFRLDTAEHGAPPFLSLSLTNPVLTLALAVATVTQPTQPSAPVTRERPKWDSNGVIHYN